MTHHLRSKVHSSWQVMKIALSASSLTRRTKWLTMEVKPCKSIRPQTVAYWFSNQWTSQDITVQRWIEIRFKPGCSSRMWTPNRGISISKELLNWEVSQPVHQPSDSNACWWTYRNRQIAVSQRCLMALKIHQTIWWCRIHHQEAPYHRTLASESSKIARKVNLSSRQR